MVDRMFPLVLEDNLEMSRSRLERRHFKQPAWKNTFAVFFKNLFYNIFGQALA